MKRNRVACVCQQCQKQFEVKASKAANGGGKYCSRHCMEASSGGIQGRFWSKVDKNGPIPLHCPDLGPCWQWTGSKVDGYGNILSADKHSIVKAHRVSWELHNGSIPDDLWVLHACDNRSCVNPAHLFLGTVQDNVKDMDKKGRRKSQPVSGGKHPAHTHGDYFLRGEQNPVSKLTEVQVIEIRRRNPRGAEVNIVAKEFGVSRETIYMILRRAIWTHIP